MRSWGYGQAGPFAEFDPGGVNPGFADPTNIPPGYIEPDIPSFFWTGQGQIPQYKCQADGSPAECYTVTKMIRDGLAAIVPGDTLIPIQRDGKITWAMYTYTGDGYAGYKPLSARFGNTPGTWYDPASKTEGSLPKFTPSQGPVALPQIPHPRIPIVTSPTTLPTLYHSSDWRFRFRDAINSLSADCAKAIRQLTRMSLAQFGDWASDGHITVYDDIDTAKKVGDAGAVAGAIIGESVIQIGSRFHEYDGNPARASVVKNALVHELLHLYTGRFDVELAEGLGLYHPKGWGSVWKEAGMDQGRKAELTRKASLQIQAFLEKNCTTKNP